MTRDGLTRTQALEMINETREMMLADPDNATDILMDELGLEMDYIFEIMGY